VAGVDAGVTEADDVSPAVASGVGQQPRVTLHAPAPGQSGVTEVRDQPMERAERTVILGKCRVWPGVAEADDVSPAVAGGVSEETRVLLDPPALLGPEVRDDELDRP